MHGLDSTRHKKYALILNNEVLVKTKQLQQQPAHFLVIIRVRFSRTGYLVPVRDALWDLPGWKCCWDVVAAAAVVGVIIYVQEITNISAPEKR